MTVDALAPFVRYAHYIEPQYMLNNRRRYGYDHRLLFCESGLINLRAGDTQYKLGKNSLLFIPSGTPYVLGSPEDGGKVIGINFDFGYQASDKTVPIVPEVALSRFDKSKQIEKGGLSDTHLFSAPFVLHGQSEIGTIIYKIFDEFTTARIYHSQNESALMKQVLILALRMLTLGADCAPQRTVNVVISYIQEHYMDDISNADIGQALSFHPNYLNRLMIKHTGRSLHQYLLYYRLNKALDRLQATSMTVAQIAESSGFSDAGHFTKAFKKQYGISPKEMRGRII